MLVVDAYKEDEGLGGSANSGPGRDLGRRKVFIILLSLLLCIDENLTVVLRRACAHKRHGGYLLRRQLLPLGILDHRRVLKLFKDSCVSVNTVNAQRPRH